jgi:hypothetical protein
MLQFARAKLSEFTDHGPGHVLRVKSFVTQLGYLQDLIGAERQLLRLGALFHDIGNIIDRGQHHIISEETVKKMTADGELPLTRKEAEIVGILCRWHRKEYDPKRVDIVRGETIRTGLLASILRVADAMDIDHRRQDYGEKFWKVLEVFFADHLAHFTSLEVILGVRIHCDPQVCLQIFTRGEAVDNIQIRMLQKDLHDTPLDWSIRSIDVQSSLPDSHPGGQRSVDKTKDKALIVFPFEPHSLVMAALSRKHLETVGYQIELLCYPETVNSSDWLWKKALLQRDMVGYTRALFINGQPNPDIDTQILTLIADWQRTGVQTSILNRHEANWNRLPQLLENGVEVYLGGDWAYFWGDPVSEDDLVWGRIAALSTRDPALSTVGISVEDHTLTQGLLFVIYEGLEKLRTDGSADLDLLTGRILDRIARDDREYFSMHAGDFRDKVLAAGSTPRIEGRVLVYEQPPGSSPQAHYWILERAIEAYGRTLERGVQFNKPYAMTTWEEGDDVELLAISHWLDEEALPIHLLYPADLGPPPEGNESIVRARIPAEQAEIVIETLLAACNQQAG